MTTVVGSAGSGPDHMDVEQVPCHPRVLPWAAGGRRGQSRMSIARLGSWEHTEGLLKAGVGKPTSGTCTLVTVK